MQFHVDKIKIAEHEIPVDINVNEQDVTRSTMLDILDKLEPESSESLEQDQQDLYQTPKRGPGRPRKGE